MHTLLLRGALRVATMDAEKREIPHGGMFCRGGVIEQVGPQEDLPREADRIIDLRGHVLLPGLINTHHHLYQTLTRAIAQDCSLFPWLRTLYPMWARLTPPALHVGALVGLAELVLGGCTTVSDHLYLFPNGVRLEDEIEAAQEIGVRFYAARGAMSVGESQGGLPPDCLVESEAEILRGFQEAVERHHDPHPHSKLRIALAPCSPFSVSRNLMRETASLARSFGVRLHTHLAENVEDLAYSRERFGLSPGEYAAECGWVGRDVWHAHGVHLNPHELRLFAESGTGIAHCPSSNLRLGSGIAPIVQMLTAGVPVGLGVDGSASNDGAQLLSEARLAMLLQRASGNAGAMTARQALWLSTRGGAEVLGWPELGCLAPGHAADWAAFPVQGELDFAGSLQDPLAALVFCHPPKAAWVGVGTRILVEHGRLVSVDLPPILERHAAFSRTLVEGI